MPSGGEIISVYANFSFVWALICTRATRIGRGLVIRNVVEFQRELDKTSGDIRDFVDTVIVNEIENEHNLLSASMKLKSSH